MLERIRDQRGTHQAPRVLSDEWNNHPGGAGPDQVPGQCCTRQCSRLLFYPMKDLEIVSCWPAASEK